MTRKTELWITVPTFAVWCGALGWFLFYIH